MPGSNKPSVSPRSLWRTRGPVYLGGGDGFRALCFEVAYGGCAGNVGPPKRGPTHLDCFTTEMLISDQSVEITKF